MDTNDLERERGITILAKCTSLVWKDTRINIVDTPGHADFGGEVERILNMVDGAIVLVDASEGSAAANQVRRFQGLEAVVCARLWPSTRSIDRMNVTRTCSTKCSTSSRISTPRTSSSTFPSLYGSGRDGWMALDPAGPKSDMSALFDLVLDHVSPPAVESGPFRMLATTLEADPFLGRILTGRITSGVVKANQAIKVLRHDGSLVETARVSKVLAFRGLERQAD